MTAHTNNNNQAWSAICTISDLATNVRVQTQQTTDKMESLSPTFQPGAHDVICARGKQALNHKGNQRFRENIRNKLEQYAASNTKIAKSLIVSDVIHAVRSAGGGFVKEKNGQWYEVGDHLAREKIGQSFRDQLHSQYRSSAKAKRSRKRQAAGQSLPTSQPPSPDTTTKTKVMPTSLEKKGLSRLSSKLLVDDVALFMKQNSSAAAAPLPLETHSYSIFDENFLRTNEDLLRQIDWCCEDASNNSDDVLPRCQSAPAAMMNVGEPLPLDAPVLLRSFSDFSWCSQALACH